MEHASHLVDILDSEGNISHSKARRDVDKQKDIYHAVYVLLITPENDVLLSTIPTRKDLPNLYSDTYGSTVATIRRHGETPNEAASRAVSKELFIHEAQPIKVGEAFETFSDSRKIFVSFYYFKSAIPDTYSAADISRLTAMTPKEIDVLTESDSKDLAPTLKTLWRKYRTKLSI